MRENAKVVSSKTLLYVYDLNRIYIYIVPLLQRNTREDPSIGLPGAHLNMTTPNAVPELLPREREGLC